jgi:3-methyladenine DNA glycosylase AlkD
MESKIITEIRKDLRQTADEKTRSGYTHYFKEEVRFYGVENAKVTGISRKYFQAIKPLSKTEIFGLCEILFKSGYCEEAFIACEWSYKIHDRYEAEDFVIFEKWVNLYIDNWAKCDTLCNHTIGSFVEKFPWFIDELKKWTHSSNRWVRRAAAVTLIIPAKKGQFLTDIFEIADNLLKDKDDLVQKGYGWLLKDAAIQHPSEIFDYVMKNKGIMPRTALRYAIERLPSDLKKQAMAR